MTPEAECFLRKACSLLGEADRVLEVDLFNAAGRAAYLAGFHAAQAIIFDRNRRVVKTHNGVRTVFQQLVPDLPPMAEDLQVFLATTYNLKSIADYEIGPDSEISAERAEQAVALAHRFVAHLAAALGG